ncbi:MAG: hypothetical protein WC622_15465 [Pedobacter sp.]|jgi:hypothetical protein|uniref:hypothetical protein n=1 Tax=Pedobacter sp. TaxID=1411316 RepID=UPI0035628F3F
MGFQPDGKMLTLRTSARLIFYRDIELYIQPEQHLNLEYIKNSAGEIIDEKVKSIDTLYTIFVRRKNQKSGIEYALEKINDNSGKPFNADSLWETLSFYKKSSSSKNFDSDIGKPLAIIEKGNLRIEKYAMKLELGQVDSIYRYYDKSMKDIPFSFSRKLDTQNKGKLFKILGISNEIPKGLLLPDMAVPRREFFHEMKVVTEKNKKKYLDIFKKFEQDSKRLNLK